VKQLADGVRQLRGYPPDAINVYLAGDVLIDAATGRAGRRILGQLDGRG
jgi:hydroxyacylglutathione hydrolase